MRDEIVSHYDSKKSFSVSERKELSTIQIRKFNNYVKLFLLRKYTSNLWNKSRGSLLDLGVGMGGDISKWLGLPLKKVLGIDISPKSIEEANLRLNSIKAKFDMDVRFEVRDAYSENIHGDSIIGKEGFDLVISNFSFHYAFSTPRNVSIAVSNVSKALKRGGYFVLTVPNFLEISEKRGRTHGNMYYNVKFISENVYEFTLKDSIDSLAEPLVDEKLLVDTCLEHDLVLYEDVPFEKINVHYFETLSHDEKQVVSLYKYYVFVKIH